MYLTRPMNFTARLWVVASKLSPPFAASLGKYFSPSLDSFTTHPIILPTQSQCKFRGNHLCNSSLFVKRQKHTHISTGSERSTHVPVRPMIPSRGPVRANKINAQFLSLGSERESKQTHYAIGITIPSFFTSSVSHLPPEQRHISNHPG